MTSWCRIKSYKYSGIPKIKGNEKNKIKIIFPLISINIPYIWIPVDILIKIISKKILISIFHPSKYKFLIS